MLNKAKTLKGYKLDSLDGEIGKVKEFYFDDQHWTLRYLVGMATVGIVYALPKLLLAGIEAGGPPLLRFLRYALLGAWVAAGAPWLFLKLGLAEREPYSANEKDLSLISK